VAFIIFYSWQSDISPKINRNFIEDTIEQTIKRLGKDFTVQKAIRDNEIRIDKDTKGVPGIPPIVDVIFNKISKCGIFIPDLTFVGKTDKGRLLPNPNVLIEYGWAIKELSYFRIIPIMNEAFGMPNGENMPFDMRHLRHPLTYHLKMDANSKEISGAKDKLCKDLHEAIRLIIKNNLINEFTQNETINKILKSSEKKQKALSGEEIYYFSPSQRDEILNSFSVEFNKAKSGKAFASSQYKNRDPQRILSGNRLDTDWTLNEESGWLEVIWEKPIMGRFILLNNRLSNSPDKDAWGHASILINDIEITKLNEKFAGSYILVIDLGMNKEITKLRCEINGNAYPGLSGLEIY
jgi:hypothetical protein